MKKLNIELTHCYGIKNLAHVFDFRNRTFAIYAPNGVMKTSFARALDDLSTGSETKDLAFPYRDTTVTFLADDNELPAENVFVIQSYDAKFKSEKISTLLANQQLKGKYDQTHKEIDKALASFTKSMKKQSGVSGRKESVEATIARVFGTDFYSCILEFEESVSHSEPQPFSDIKYNEIFKDKIITFLNTKDFKTLINDYIEKYDQLVAESPILRNEFKFHNADETDHLGQPSFMSPLDYMN